METRKVGSYAVATIQSRPWLSATSSTLNPGGSASTTTKQRKSKAQPVIVNPIFAECAQLTDDPLWKTIFENASHGKFPRGFTFKDNILTYKIRSKVFTFRVPEMAYEALPHCVEFIKRTAKISSEADKMQDRLEIEERLQNQLTLEQCSWGDIKKKKVKALLISAFIEETARNYGLNVKEKDYMKMIVSIGFSLGYLSKDDIVFIDGHIVNINGLCYDANRKKFFIHPERMPKLKKSSANRAAAETKAKFSFLDMWFELVNYYCSLLMRKRTKKETPAINPSVRLHIVDSSPETSIGTPNPTTASAFVSFNTGTTY